MESDDKLVKYANQTGLETTAALSLADVFKPIFEKARAAINDAQGVAESVKDATCVKEIHKSRTCRLALRAVRIESEATRKKQKEHALLYGRAVDGFHNILLADLSPVETALQEAEDIAERAEAARLSELQSTREKELQPFLETPVPAGLCELSEDLYQKMLAGAKLVKQAKIEAALKAEAEAKAKAEAERLERERIAAENARLRAEAVAREAAVKLERDLAAEKARKEREAIESKARAERELAAEKARKEREALETKAKALQAAVEEEQRKLKALQDAEAKKLAAIAAAKRKAAAAPDNAKAQAFANSLRKLSLPEFSTDSFDLLPQKIEALAKWIEFRILENDK